MDEGPDPLEPPRLSPSGATSLAVAGLALGLAAVVILPIVSGVAGMVAGSLAHLKGSRLGIPASAVAALGMLAGLANEFLLRT